MRALIVDDSRALRRIMSDILRDMSFEVAEAGNGLEALRRLGSGDLPDVVLVDWNMPEMDGLELVRTIRRDQRLRKLPVVMVTSETEMDRMASALAAGANEYVMKPFDKDIVADKLQLVGVI